MKRNGNAFHLILIIVCAVLTVSCAAATAEDEFFDKDFNISESGKVNFGGLSFNVATMSNKKPTTNEEILGFSTDSTFGDEILTRIANIQKENNCTIGFKDGGFDLDDAKLALFAGVHFSDVLVGEYLTARKWAPSGILMPVDEYSDVIDVTDDFRWGGKYICEGHMSGGTIYGLSPMCWPGNFGGYVFLIVSNNDLLLQNGFSRPYEYVENGTWTDDKIVEICNGVLDKERDIHGIATNFWFNRMCLLSNGVRFAVWDDIRKEYVNGYSTMQAVNAINWCKDFFGRLKDSYVTCSGWGYNEEHFNDGKAAFVLMVSNDIMRFTYYNTVMSDFSALPFPTGPDVEYGDWQGYLSYESTSVYIPYTEINVTEAATFMSMLLEPFSGVSSEEELMKYYAGNVFMDERDPVYIFKAMKNSLYAAEAMEGVLDTLLGNKYGGTGAEISQTIAPMFDSEIEETIIPNLLGLSKYFPEDN